jgi:thiol-disulfide isomerase/thioredoxin
VVVIRFGHDWDETCMQMDEVLASVADKIKNSAVIYLVDITEVPDFNAMYELYDPCTIMFFFRNKVGRLEYHVFGVAQSCLSAVKSGSKAILLSRVITPGDERFSF